MAEKLIKRGASVALPIPKELAERYHLEPGVQVEIEGTDAGILLTPIGVPHWFSFEWERALDAVMDRYGTALGMLQEANAVGESQ